MANQIESVYQGALLADAAYIDFGGLFDEFSGQINDDDNARDEFLKRGFTEDQFNTFRERYEIIDHVQSNISGLSATLFRDRFDGGKPILAFRGTETTLNAAPADLITDLLLTLGIDEAGLQAPGQEGLMDEWRDAGHFSPDNPLAVVGHSLGGHLSLKAAAEYNDLVSDVVTFNGAGINPIEDLFVSDQLDPSKVTRVVSEPGFEVTANDFFFKQYGDTEHRLFIHKQSVVSDYESFSDLAIGNHSMVHLVDTFSVMRLLGAVSPSASVKEIDDILWKAHDRVIEKVIENKEGDLSHNGESDLSSPDAAAVSLNTVDVINAYGDKWTSKPENICYFSML